MLYVRWHRTRGNSLVVQPTDECRALTRRTGAVARSTGTGRWHKSERWPLSAGGDLDAAFSRVLVGALGPALVLAMVGVFGAGAFGPTAPANRHARLGANVSDVMHWSHGAARTRLPRCDRLTGQA